MIKNWISYIAALSVALVLCLSATSARAQDEYTVKAAFIYNFFKFVEWPGSQTLGSKSQVNICVLGDSPLSGAADFFKRASNASRSYTLINETDAKRIGENCYVLFIGAAEEGRLKEILSALRDKPVLIIGESEGFVEKGGMIGFMMVGNNVKFVINMEPVKAAGFRINPQMLELAAYVIGR